MKHTEIADGALRVPLVSLGCWAFGEAEFWGEQDDAESIATVHAALDLGVTMFDTAESYGDGRSEEVLGRALQGRRDEALIATKASPKNFGKESVIAACDQSLRRLRTDVIDLYQLHWPSGDFGLDETFAGLLELYERGSIRAVGVCNFGVRDVARAVEEARRSGLPVVTDQLPYNLLWRAIEHGTMEACREHELAVLAYSPLAQGLLTGKFDDPDQVPETRARTRLFSRSRPRASHGEAGAEDATFAAIAAIRQISDDAGVPMAHLALAWLLHRPGVATVIAGARRPAQIRDTAAAAEVALPADVIAALDDATRRVKDLVGDNADMWRGNGRIR